MALSPADFAAYSQAAGIPYPEDPEERAALAPAVRDFRQNQLRQQESGPNLGALAGLAAVGLGALGLGLAARRGFGAKAAGGGRKGGVTLADLNDPRNAAVSQVAETAVKPSVPTQRSLIPTEAEALEQYTRQLGQTFPEPTASEMEALGKPSRLGKILANLGTSAQYRPDPKDINYARFGPPSPEVAAARREQATQDLLRFAQQRQEDAAITATQTIGALESGEDQLTGRIMRGAQRNEDLDLAQVNTIAKQTGSADFATSLTPDGVPVDQVEIIAQETSAQRFLQRERDEIASQLGEQGLPISPSRIEAELANRLSGSEAWTYGPKYTQRKQALQLGATYNPSFFENLKTPSVQIAGETIPTEQLKEPVAMEETALRLQERIADKRDWLGQVRLEEQKNKVRLNNVNKEIKNLNAYQGEIVDFLKSGKASPKQMQLGQQRLTDLSADLDRLDTLQNELSNLVYLGDKRIAGARSYVEGAIGEMQLPQKLKSGIEEGMRVFYETDEAGNPIPESMELRGERQMRDLPAKGGGGRNIGEYTAGERLNEEIRAIQGGGRIRDYDPETGSPIQRWEGDKTQTGRELDIYGVRLSSERKDDPEMRPSKPGPSRTPLTRVPTEQSREAFDVARQLRQLQTSGRPEEAQAFLDKIMKQRGISGASGTFSPL